MNLKHIALVLILSTGIVVHAEEIKLVEKDAATVLYRDSSEANRIGKKFSANWELFGSGPAGTSESGVSAAYHLNRNSLIQLEYGKGGFSSFWSDLTSISFNGSHIGLHFKHFAGNSFYFKTGIDYRQIQYRYNYNSLTTDGAYDFEGNSIGASFVIGNQWQWDNFTLGCDWIGLTAPLTSEVTHEHVSVEGPYTRQDMYYAEDNRLKSTYVQALRFYVGYSF
ncbi:MAG: hypothetical protein ACKOX6_06190 [Bdellovibrio sp.]